MSGLVLKLGPKERVLINGAVIENGERRGRISVLSPNANILRLKDAIHPDAATTPCSRLCYAVQLLLSGDGNASEIRDAALKDIERLSQIFTDPDSRRILSDATSALIEKQDYRCLKSLRSLLPREARLMAVDR